MGQVKELSETREELDRIDNEILRLFCDRMDLVQHVAEYKIAKGMEIFHPDREDAILDRVRASAAAPYEDYAVSLFEKIMELSRGLQKNIMEENGKDGSSGD